MKKINEITTEQLKGNYQRLFKTDDGEMVLEHLKTCFGFYQTTYAKGDSHDTAFFEGQRSVVLNVLRMMEPQKKLQQPEGINNE
tara:strand:- start:238 stop:489 length:252 start_codon:yes stop_codon:yes gene_type:complete